MKKSGGVFIWVAIWLFFTFGSGFLEQMTSGDGSAAPEEDRAMQTQSFDTKVTVGEDQSYTVSEDINVSFLEYRHGIYRYVPKVGAVYSNAADGTGEKTPYNAKIELIDCNVPITTSSQNGSKLFRLGDEGLEVYRDNQYQLSYKVTPRFQTEGYSNANYNVFPTNWQNFIPAGSTFVIDFPKDFNHDDLQFYYGRYGEDKDAASIIELSWSGNTVSGFLKQNLSLGEGLTFDVAMEPGYFTNTNTLPSVSWLLLLPAVLIFIVVLLLFLFLGRDEKIIPSIQYQPPQELDSASVGYIIDGSAEFADILSLIIYWADKGYLRMEEPQKDALRLYKKRDLPKDAPSYQQTVFRGLFGAGNTRDISDLQYQFTGTLDIAKRQLKKEFTVKGQGALFTRSSQIAQVCALVLCTLPLAWFMLITSVLSYTSLGRGILQIVLWTGLFAGCIVFRKNIDKWYAKTNRKRKTMAFVSLMICFLSTAIYFGSYAMRVWQKEVFNYIWVLLVIMCMTAVMVIVAGFMKKRTPQCVAWMGRLSGLRDFIETAELDRMQELAGGNPEWFYHIIPYAYVFGLSDVFAKKLEGLTLPAPDWYGTYRQYNFFDYYLFNMCMVNSLRHTTQMLTVPEPPKAGETGGFGGGFSGGGGGFSGGGFGGGGGGSW